MPQASNRAPVGGNRLIRLIRSSHAARHEAANQHALRGVGRPNHRVPSLVWLCYHGVIWHFDPDPAFGIGGPGHTNSIVSIPGFPIGVLNDVAVGKRATESLPARQMLEPVVQRRIFIASVQVPSKCERRCGYHDRSNTYQQQVSNWFYAMLAHSTPPQRK
jgi:hypothetical protein